MRVLEGHTGVVTSLAYAQDGRVLASGGRDGAVCLWDPLAGKLLRTCRTNGLGSPVSSVAVSPSGGVVAAGLTNGEACTWFVGDGAQYRRYPLAPGQLAGPPVFVAFRLDDEGILAARRLEISEWRLDSDKPVRAFALPNAPYSHRPECTSLTCTEDGRIAAGYRDSVSIWYPHYNNPESGPHWPSGDVVAVRFAPDGHSLALARGRSVGLWQPHERERARYRRVREMRHGDQVRACAFTPDGRTLLSAGDDWTVHLWDVATGQERGSFNFRLGPVLALAVAPDGMTAAVSGRDRPGIVLFDLE